MDEKEHKGRREREDVYSNAVRAGKRTYFFDVKSTRKKDYFLTITESKRFFHDDGTKSYKKHKIFVYKEDFEKFSEALKDAVMKIIELNKQQSEELESEMESKFTDVSFDELGSDDEHKGSGAGDDTDPDEVTSDVNSGSDSDSNSDDDSKS